MLQPDHSLTATDLTPELSMFWSLSGKKIQLIESNYDHSCGSPVFTEGGKYTTRGWTEWTQGFEFGSGIFQFEATGDEWFLEFARTNTLDRMAPHLSHFGVHDHGFNNVSTYGNLLRLQESGICAENQWERDHHRLALKLSGAVQAKRWTNNNNGGFIHSFNGPHSLFVDTIRSCRSLAIAHLLGHRCMDEGDSEVSMLERLIQHAKATAQYSIYYGDGRDRYDTEPGRTTHEAIFNTASGQFRCPSTQQGYSAFSTWTRGLAWAMLGFAEELEFIRELGDTDLDAIDGRKEIEPLFLKAACATCDFYINNTPIDGIPYWDTGAPGLEKLGQGYLERKSDPFNDHEPVDSSAAAIGAQGLLRLGRYLGTTNKEGKRYFQAGLSVARSLFSEPFLSTSPTHQGLILHSIYHHPNGWDHVPAGSLVPNGESSMWGDYHARELAHYIGKIASGSDYRFFDCVPQTND
ncbi:MAG: glycosyl hydrolase [Verrucomicrobiaceae bacterium]|nr:glycosyl hydrolase [Verrucomicrobiaceae bacterium]